jgi:LuxR family transcriptional regulator, regulator of acetate metabolism
MSTPPGPDATSMPEIRPQLFAGPLGELLLRRLEHAVDEAQAVLDRPLEAGEASDPSHLRAAITALTDQLPDASRGMIAEHAAALERLRQRFEIRFEALARVQSAVGALREVTSPSEMLARAPALLCEASALTRAILSVVRGRRLVPDAAEFVSDPERARAVVAALRVDPLRLEHPLIETELMRRRRATIVVDAPVHPRVDRRLTELMGWRSYVAAPLVVGSQVIGLIHADRGPEQPLDVLDRDVLWEFVSGLAQAYESATLRRTLRRERDQMRQFLEWLNARSGELTDAPISLAGDRRALAPPEPLESSAPPEGRDDRVVFEGLLTRRELEVLRLLADGSTNRAIADALVISGGTVKFHVNSILRKLHAANRAEAVSRYLRLLGMRAP